MKRSVQICLSLLAVVLLLKPLECFAAGAPNRQGTECCLKGQCTPTVKSDACCKNTAPDTNQLGTAKTVDHSRQSVAVASAPVSTPALGTTFQASASLRAHPPPSASLGASNLPLLI